MSELALKLIAENERTRSIRLDLSNCGMAEIPEEIGKLFWLEELIIGGDYYYDYEKKDGVSTQNKGEKNTLSRLPDKLANLRSLKKLVIGGERSHKLPLIDISPIVRLVNLRCLQIDYASLSDIKPVQILRGLQMLFFNSNQVSSLEPLKGLSSLQMLFFNSNQVSSLEPLKGLSSLQMLSFDSNQVSSLEPLKGLSSLQTLYFESNQVSSLEPLIHLSSLARFSCSENTIKDCPADVYQSGDVSLLHTFFEAQKKKPLPPGQSSKGNKSTSSQKAVISLDNRHDVKLIVLGNSNAGKTNLVEYLEKSSFTGVRNTTHGLEVHRWQPDAKRFPELANITVSIWDFGGQEYYHDAYRLFLSDNAVYVLLWCQESNINGRRPTVLRQNKPASELEHFELRYWLDTVRHYSGATGKAGLLVVQNKTDDPDGKNGNPFFFKKRVDQALHEKYGIRESYHISLREALQNGVPRQQKLLEHFVSELQDLIKTTADTVAAPPHWQQVRQQILQLKEKHSGKNPFAPYLKDKPWVTLQQFKRACGTFVSGGLLVNKRKNIDEVTGIPLWLEKGGTVVYFPKNPELSDKIFLQPDELADRIYGVLNNDVYEAKGEFLSSGILPDETPKNREVYLQLLQQLNLIYPHPDLKKRTEGYFLAPQYLPDVHPIEELFKIASRDAWQNGLWIKVPLFYYKKILHGLLLAYAGDENTECRYYWKHGIIFLTRETPTSEPVRVLIKGLYPEEDELDGVLLIGMEENGQNTKGLQKQIFTRVLTVLTGYQEEKNKLAMRSGREMPAIDGKQPEAFLLEKLTAKMEADLFVSYDSENYVSYKTLQATTEPKVLADPKMKKPVKPQNETDRQPGDGRVKDVWLLTQKFEAIMDHKPTRAKKVFLSYSHQNTAWLTRLRAHLSGLRRAKEIETWDDREILPGDQWDASIKKQLEEADVYILLLSADFIASEYIWEKELSTAIDSYHKRKAIIIPILFEPLDLGGIPGISPVEKLKDSGTEVTGFKIGDFEIIPKTEKEQQLKPVSLWPNQEEALAIVAKRIRQAIQGRE